MDRCFGVAPVPNQRTSLSIFRVATAGGLMLACGLLCACVEETAQAPDPTVPHATNIARRAGVSPSGATVALASFSGAPQALDARLASIFSDAAKRSDLAITDAKSADYLVRGYLTARPEGKGTAVAYVLDVFDAKKRRAQRVADEVVVNSQAADPWSVVDDSVLTSVAAKSADDLAAVMTNTPEAIAADGVPSQGHNSPPESGQTAVAATPPAAQPPASAPSPNPNSVGMAALR